MNEFSTILEIEGIPFVIKYFYYPGEKMTFDYPGSSEDVECDRILFAGEELSQKQEEFFIEKYGKKEFDVFLQEDVVEQYRSAIDMKADFEYEQWKERRGL